MDGWIDNSTVYKNVCGIPKWYVFSSRPVGGAEEYVLVVFLYCFSACVTKNGGVRADTSYCRTPVQGN